MERLEQPWKTVNHYLSAYGVPPHPPFIYFQNLADYFAAGEEYEAGA
jgi:hypothetical protein